MRVEWSRGRELNPRPTDFESVTVKSSCSRSGRRFGRRTSGGRYQSRSSSTLAVRGCGDCTASTAIFGGTSTRRCRRLQASASCWTRLLQIQRGSSGDSAYRLSNKPYEGPALLAARRRVAGQAAVETREWATSILTTRCVVLVSSLSWRRLLGVQP